jgi:probable LLM family oxidoreductase
MELGIDSFASREHEQPVEAIQHLLERIETADRVGLDVFGVGEHHRAEFLDSAPSIILAAAAARTQHIKLTSAVTVLSAADPVRVFQQFATLDLVSKGRAEMVVGRGSFTESFPLFGLDFSDYDDLFAEKLELLLKLRAEERVTWSGKFRPALHDQAVYPRPLQAEIPIWVGVGGTPESFVRAGLLGLPLMVAVIGGETHRFRRAVDLYRAAGAQAGHAPEKLKVGLHSLGYVAPSREEAVQDYFPGYAKTFTRIGRERGWPPVSRERFDAQNGPTGALLVGDPDEVGEKILRHAEALGGVDRVTFQMDNAELPREKLLRSIQLIGERIKPALSTH